MSVAHRAQDFLDWVLLVTTLSNREILLLLYDKGSSWDICLLQMSQLLSKNCHSAGCHGVHLQSQHLWRLTQGNEFKASLNYSKTLSQNSKQNSVYFVLYLE